MKVSQLVDIYNVWHRCKRMLWFKRSQAQSFEGHTFVRRATAQQAAMVTLRFTAKSVCSSVGCWHADQPNHVGLIREEEMAAFNNVRGNERQSTRDQRAGRGKIRSKD